MRERGNGSKQSISCLDKALSVAEARHTVFSLTDTSQYCACTTHTKTHSNKQEQRKLFRSKFTSPAPTCFVVCCDCFQAHKQTHTYTPALRVTASPPSDKSHSGKMPSFHYTYNFQTVTQVKPALVVDLNGLACVIRRGFVTLLLTRVEHGSDCPALSRPLYWEREFNFIIWAFKRHSSNVQAFVKTETETESTGGVEQRKGSVRRIENETSWCLQYFMLFSGTGTLYPRSSCTL